MNKLKNYTDACLVVPISLLIYVTFVLKLRRKNEEANINKK